MTARDPESKSLRREPPAGDGSANGAIVPGLSTIRGWALELGFSSLGVADIDLRDAGVGLKAWVEAGFHGELDYMVRHGEKRWQPAELLAGTRCALMVTLDYAPQSAAWISEAWARLAEHERAFVSRYALGRDYHKVMRSRLAALALRINQAAGPLVQRVYCDSAPVMEVELARKAGLGWRGKHTLLIHRHRGSMFFLGTLYTSLPLSGDDAAPIADDGEHCGSCRRCIDVCPTGAIVAPYRLDARRCISYLTIELKGAIPVQMRPAIGNRIYGCDDCQLVCPWNRYAAAAGAADFAVRNGLDNPSLIGLFEWSPEQFEQRMAGSAIRRIGHERWLRNLAVAMGNALANLPQGPAATAIRRALAGRIDHSSALVREHVAWALAQGGEQLAGPSA